MALPPDFRSDGCLQEGIHEADWTDFEKYFGYNTPRSQLLKQLLGFCHLLQKAKCAKVYIDGSFVTSKPYPRDIDLCYDLYAVDETLFSLWTRASSQKQFPLLDVLPDPDGAYLNLFQIVRQTDASVEARKGIVCLLLDTLPPAK